MQHIYSSVLGQDKKKTNISVLTSYSGKNYKQIGAWKQEPKIIYNKMQIITKMINCK